MTTIWLVRHATTAWTGQRYCGRSDPPLDETGRRAATALATDLAPRLPHEVRVVSSPRIRAVATATAIVEAVGGGSVEVDDRWSEVDMGIAEGQTFEALEAIDPELAHRLVSGDATIDWPGGETNAAFEARVLDALRSLTAVGRPTVLVSHAGPLRLAMARLEALPVSAIALAVPASVTSYDV